MVCGRCRGVSVGGVGGVGVCRSRGVRCGCGVVSYGMVCDYFSTGKFRSDECVMDVRAFCKRSDGCFQLSTYDQHRWGVPQSKETISLLPAPFAFPLALLPVVCKVCSLKMPFSYF